MKPKKRQVRIREDKIVRVNHAMGSVLDPATGEEHTPDRGGVLGFHYRDSKKLTGKMCALDGRKIYQFLVMHLPLQTFYEVACMMRLMVNQMEADRAAQVQANQESGGPGGGEASPGQTGETGGPGSDQDTVEEALQPEGGPGGAVA